jgi:redox-sensitive bicupin YhaK (pirin superfamily)
MSAGRGIIHSEFNHEDEPTLLFQIWIEPAVARVEPRWDSRQFPRSTGTLVALASGRDRVGGALPIHQDATVLGATLAAGQSIVHELGSGRRAYLVPARGTVEVNGVTVPARAGAAITGVDNLTIRSSEDSEIVLADLP